MRKMYRKWKRGMMITVENNFKTGATLSGKVMATAERPGYLRVKWEDGRETFIHKESQIIMEVR